MWDPKNRPTTLQALNHEYFADAVDPLRPKSATARLLGRKHSDVSYKSAKEGQDSPTPSTKSSWFRKSLVPRESIPPVPQHTSSPRPSPMHYNSVTESSPSTNKTRPAASKRATWTNGTTPGSGAPMPILPSIRPISPLSNAVTAQGNSTITNNALSPPEPKEAVSEPKAAKKIGRQLSVASHGNHYADIHRQEAERALNGQSGLMSPPSGQKESFFSHLRKRARRLSGRHPGPMSPSSEDIEANAGCGPWASNRSSVAMDTTPIVEPRNNAEFTQLDRALQNMRSSLEASADQSPAYQAQTASRKHQSLPQVHTSRTNDTGPVAGRTRRALQRSTNPVYNYETPDEEDELLDEMLNSTHKAVRRLDQASDSSRGVLSQKDTNRQPLRHANSTASISNAYPTPSPSAKREGIIFGQDVSKLTPAPLDIVRSKSTQPVAQPHWPTPPYEDNEWASSAAASIFAAGSAYR